tara:strand:+ start:320 stop:949 length:630 start_codon:yes stop_codon:yes gene_type:complete
MSLDTAHSEQTAGIGLLVLGLVAVIALTSGRGKPAPTIGEVDYGEDDVLPAVKPGAAIGSVAAFQDNGIGSSFGPDESHVVTAAITNNSLDFANEPAPIDFDEITLEIFEDELLDKRLQTIALPFSKRHFEAGETRIVQFGFVTEQRSNPGRNARVRVRKVQKRRSDLLADATVHEIYFVREAVSTPAAEIGEIAVYQTTLHNRNNGYL